MNFLIINYENYNWVTSSIMDYNQIFADDDGYPDPFKGNEGIS